ncbi:histone-lysine N-methyltransferase, H3 lysine-9 specific SUVH6-like [Solanum stenotomum]|uniref:histone-lysine N-methyltransferase, H3 lysine-9 specific SUVH6-like n=1 Tax=Solanum stenotomum TaxID=172797 RepID=UPI0020D0F6F5|nr:histone-lysine N-methyltransferase, H3 lysine-9 specific SUVH6-like [Solanum stenotomum]
MSVLAETMSPTKMLGKKKLHQMVDTKSPSTFKRLKVDATRNFPENCGSFVCQNNGTREINPEFPSNTKRVKVDSMRSFPENCGPCFPQKRVRSDTQCYVDVESKSCFEVATNVVESARPKEVGGSSHLNTSCRPTNGNQQHEVLVSQALQKPSTDTCDWFIKDEPIENVPELPAIVSQENLIEALNELNNKTSQRVHHEEVSDIWVDDDDISILTCSEWNSLRSGLNTQSTDGKKGGKEGEIIHKCSDILEEAVDFKPLPGIIRPEQHDELNKGQYFFCKDWDEYESVVMKKQINLGVSQEDLRNSDVLCGASGYGLLTEYEHIQKVKEVKETLKLFDDVYTKLLQEDKAEKHEGRSKKRIHIETAMNLKKQKKWVNCEWTFGHVPGVQIGDQFRFRAELVAIGLHHQFIKGINYVTIGRKDVASSIVDSRRYDNEAISSETFIYVGQGGNPKVSLNGRVEDQKLEGSNLALKNSMDLGYPVRVICSRQRLNGEKSDIRYIYDGLYTVTKCWEERAPTEKYIFKFELKRNLDQPKLTRELVSRPAKLVKVTHSCVNKATKSVIQSEFVVDYDVSQGKEKIPIRVVNAIDDERLPPFTYITNMQYPDWYYISRPQSCNCTSGCSDSEQCSCASRNGGEIPFNTRGSIVRAQPLVYDCGPSCKCPPSCKNRVSQHGPRYHLEVFKTKSRGWGLRSRDHVSSRSFLCEYVGELLDEKEAENRIGHDEYLFDIGNYDEEIPKRNVARNNNLKVESNSLMRKDEDGFTLDALRYGNAGRFINHSCSPNLYAQNVMYYHGDKRVPHIMFFASESIAPLEELTYHYNYHVDHVSDKNGDMKRKNCRCGSRKCEGRMY